MIYLLYTVHVIVSIFLILVVLLQQGKGADLSVFGGGSTQTAFGARGAATVLHKLTVVCFIGFILTTLGIAVMKTSARGSSVIDDVAVERPADGEASDVTTDAATTDAATTDAADGGESATTAPDGDNGNSGDGGSDGGAAPESN